MLVALLITCLLIANRVGSDSPEPVTVYPMNIDYVDECNYTPLFSPTSYDIQLDLDYPSESYKGSIIITGEVIEPTSEVKFDSQVNVEDVRLISPYGYREGSVVNDTNSVVTLEFNEDLKPNQEYRILLNFNGKILSTRGIFGRNYTGSDGVERYFVATEFQPIYARNAFPCVDRPSAKAHFRLNISRDINLIALSNTRKIHTSPYQGNPSKMWDTFEETPKMSTYTFAFVVGDFVKTEAPRNNTIWVARGRPLELAEFPSKLIPHFQKDLEKLTGISYDLPKLDHVAMPYLVSVAMENWGLITYKEEIFLMDPKKSSVNQELTLIFTLAHEMAHQWFGNLVTCQSWSYTWLNEGIASFLQYIITGKEYPEWDTMGFLLSEEVRSIMEDDGFAPMALTKEGCNIAETDSFSLSSYYKGAAVLRMVQHLFSKDGLITCLRSYLKENSFKAVDENNFWKHLENRARSLNILPHNENFTTLMKTWTNNEGLPLLTVTRELNRLKLEQKGLDYFKQMDGVPNDYKWWIPYSFTTSSEMDFENTSLKGWLNPDTNETVIDLNLNKDDFAIFNIQQTGYYRVNYDNETWNLIIDQLKRDHSVIHPINRAQLIDDAFTLARLKELNYQIVLNLSGYLRDEIDYYPWAAAIQKLNNIRISLKLSPVLTLFEKYLVTLVEKVYSTIPEDNNVYEKLFHNPKDRLLASKVLEFACELKLKSCEKRAIETSKLLLNGQGELYRTVRDSKIPLMCTMVRKGGEEIWNLAWEMFKQEKTTKQKEMLLEALTCTHNKSIIKKFIQNVFESSLELTPMQLLVNFHYRDNYCTTVEIIGEIAGKNKTRLVEMVPILKVLVSIMFPKQCQDELKAIILANKEYLDEWSVMVSAVKDSAPNTWKYEKQFESWLLTEMDEINSIIETGSLYTDYSDNLQTDDMLPWQDYDLHDREKRRRMKEAERRQRNDSSYKTPLDLMISILALFLFFNFQT